MFIEKPAIDALVRQVLAAVRQHERSQPPGELSNPAASRSSIPPPACEPAGSLAPLIYFGTELFGLVPQEAKVLLAQLQALGTKEAADRLEVSTSSVEMAWGRIYDKVQKRFGKVCYRPRPAVVALLLQDFHGD
ncbi:MAG: hypothetical protein IT376_04415 [Polyangiaceae bacterium]|nr:hypothetical protein [Polyangiaceae bacterium]